MVIAGNEFAANHLVRPDGGDGVHQGAAFVEWAHVSHQFLGRRWPLFCVVGSSIAVAYLCFIRQSYGSVGIVVVVVAAIAHDHY